MPYLRVEDRGEVIVEVDDGLVVHKRIHWVNNRSQECTGDDCPLCALEMSPSDRYQLTVQHGGQQKIWEMSKKVYGQLRGLAGDIKDVAGKLIRIRRTGKGIATRYFLQILGEGEEQASSNVTYMTPEVSHILEALDAVICDRRFADLLEEYLK